MTDVFGDQIRQRPLKLIPDEFIRVEFGRVAWEEVRVNSGVAAQEGLNQFGAVNLAAIPQQHNVTSQMPGQSLQEASDLKGADIFIGMETNIERQMLSFGRNRDCGDGRDFRPVARHAHDRRLPSGRPGFSDIGNQKEAAFVEKDKRCAKPLSVFLYAATPAVSTVGWLSRLSPELVSPASDSSSPSLGVAARYGLDGKAHETFSESLGQCVSASTNPWNAPTPEALGPEPLPVGAFDWSLTGLVAPDWDANANRANRVSGKTPSSASQNCDGRLLDEPQPTDWSGFLADGEPAGGASPTVAGILLVSCM